MTTYHFIGIKGTGMSSLAQILHDSGEKVQGSDVEKRFFTQDALEAKNIEIMPLQETTSRKASRSLQGMHSAKIMKKYRRQRPRGCRSIGITISLGNGSGNIRASLLQARMVRRPQPVCLLTYLQKIIPLPT